MKILRIYIYIYIYISILTYEHIGVNVYILIYLKLSGTVKSFCYREIAIIKSLLYRHYTVIPFYAK